MDFELRGSLFSLYYRWRAAPSLSVNGIKWHRLLLLLFPMILFPCGLLGPQEGLVGCQCWTLTVLLATASPALSLLRPARLSCHGSQVFHTHTHMHSHPLRAPPTLQHYPHLLHYYALLSPCSLVIFTRISPPPFVCSVPRAECLSSRRIDGSIFVLFVWFVCFEECIDIWAGITSVVFIFPNATWRSPPPPWYRSKDHRLQMKGSVLPLWWLEMVVWTKIRIVCLNICEENELVLEYVFSF